MKHLPQHTRQKTLCRIGHVGIAALLAACTSNLEEAFSDQGLEHTDTDATPAETGVDETDEGTSPEAGAEGTDENPPAETEATETEITEVAETETAETDDTVGTDDPDAGTDDPDAGTDEPNEPTDPSDSGTGSPIVDSGTPIDAAEPDADGPLPDCAPDGISVGAGSCVCADPEPDRDNDGTSDCDDECDFDPDKTEPGECGCGVGEVTSGFGPGATTSCVDGCPDDPDKMAPGRCGCNTPDTENSEDELLCEVLGDGLRHRYSFTAANTMDVPDLVGNADAVTVNVLTTGGVVNLAGGDSNQYVDLPNDVLGGLTNATVEAWVVWTGGEPWQRIFDFGSNDGGEDAQGQATDFFNLVASTDRSQAPGIQVELGFGPGDASISLPDAFPTGTLTHIAVVVNDTGNEVVLYLDGEAVGTTDYDYSLSALSPVNNWLGRSQFTNDPEFGGSFNEFRIYAVALSDEDVAFSFALGPDAELP